MNATSSSSQASQALPIVLNLIAAVLGASGQYLYKLGAEQLGKTLWYKNWQIGVGALLFIGVMGLFIAAFKMGGRLSVTYPMYATTFLWGALIGAKFSGESLSLGQWMGLGLIIIGVALIGIYAPTHSHL